MSASDAEAMDLLGRASQSFDSVPSPFRKLTPLFWKTVVTQNTSVRKEERVSIMYSFMPSLTSCLPLRSIRGAVSGISGSGGRGRGGGDGGGGGGEVTKHGGDSYHLGAVRSSSSSPLSGHEATLLNVSTSTDESTYSETYSAYPEFHAVPGPPSKNSGINWHYGRLGLELMSSAARTERNYLTSDYDSDFERAAYLDGVGYLLKGLPRLDESEMSGLRRAIPPWLGDSVWQDGQTSARGQNDDGIRFARPQANRNVIHSCMLFLLLSLLHLIRRLAPYIFLFFSQMMRYEREYRVSENVLGTTMASVTVGLSAVRKIGDGPAGRKLAHALDYTAEGVSGALKEFAKEMSHGNQTVNLTR